MAAPFSITPSIGSNLVRTITAANITAGSTTDARLGEQRWGSDGKRYVYAQADETILASTAVCTVSPTTFLAEASGGSYKAPATNMATGDRGWFAAASV